MLATADTEELNFILLNVNCAALAEVVSRVTMEMLTCPDQRLPELQVLTRLVSSTLFSAVSRSGRGGCEAGRGGRTGVLCGVRPRVAAASPECPSVDLAFNRMERQQASFTSMQYC